MIEIDRYLINLRKVNFLEFIEKEEETVLKIYFNNEHYIQFFFATKDAAQYQYNQIHSVMVNL